MGATSTYLKNLQDERNSAWHDACEIIERARNEKRDMTADEKQKWERISARGGVLDKLDEQISTMLERERTAAENDRLRADAGIAGVVRPAIGGQSGRANETDNAAWREFFDAAQNEKRSVVWDIRADLSVGTSTAGGVTAPTAFYPLLREYLTAFSAVYRIGATIIPTPDGRSLPVPVNNVAGTATIVGEGSAIAENDPAFTSITLGAWKYTRLLQATNELLTDTQIDLNGFIAKDSARALTLAYGPDFANGNGTNKPTGYMTGLTTGTTIQTASTGVPSYANIVDVVHAVPAQYRQTTCKWTMSDSAVAACRKIVDTTNRPIWQPSMIVGQPDVLLGYEVVTDSNITALGTAAGTSIAFGDFSGYYVRDVGVQFDNSADYAFANDMMTFRIRQRLDGKYADKTGVRALVSPTT